MNESAVPELAMLAWVKALVPPLSSSEFPSKCKTKLESICFLRLLLDNEVHNGYK